MTILHNCHTDGDEYRITKFSDGEVESSYLCSFDECQCPAGSRPTCRHRLMLPMFIDRGAVNTFWFLDFERKGWVSNEPARFDMDYSNNIGHSPAYDALNCDRSELGSQQAKPSIIYSKTFPDDISSEDLAKAWSTILDQNVTDVVNGTPIVEVKSLPSTKPSWRRL